jgi:hypothetical protein
MIAQNKSEFEKANILHWHKKGYKGKGAVVVVLDDNGKPLKETDVIQPIPNKKDKYGHLTSVAAVVREVAPDCTIYGFNWLGAGKKEIVKWIKEHEQEIDVINCSFSGNSVKGEFWELESLDIPIISTSGNNGRASEINAYARLDWTISVGAWLETMDSKAGYSNAGEKLDVVGYTNIWIPSRSNYKDYTMFRGTSAAAPFVSGMLAVYIGARKRAGLPKWSREDVKEFVQANTIDKEEKGHDFESGHGLFVLPDEVERRNPQMIFPDTRNHWSREVVDRVTKEKIMNGYPDGTFKPDGTITRAEIAAIVARILEHKGR